MFGYKKCVCGKIKKIYKDNKCFDCYMTITLGAVVILAETQESSVSVRLYKGTSHVASKVEAKPAEMML